MELRGLDAQIAPYHGEAGFELIAPALGVPRPLRPTSEATAQDGD